MFALEIETVCCSSASCIALVSSLLILSISSIMQNPLLHKGNAPASKLQPFNNSSLTTDAVNPAPDTPLPETYLDFGVTLAIRFKSCDLPAPGSPINKT